MADIIAGRGAIDHGTKSEQGSPVNRHTVKYRKQTAAEWGIVLAKVERLVQTSGELTGELTGGCGSYRFLSAASNHKNINEGGQSAVYGPSSSCLFPCTQFCSAG